MECNNELRGLAFIVITRVKDEIIRDMFELQRTTSTINDKLSYLAYLGAYLGARNMVKWGVPEKILQNAVQTRWS